MAQITQRFGAVPNLGTTYVQVGPNVPAATTWNILLNATNRTGANSLLRAYIATASWVSTEPVGGTLVAAFCYDTILVAGQVFQVSYIILNAGEKLVVRASVAASIDVIVDGVAIT